MKIAHHSHIEISYCHFAAPRPGPTATHSLHSMGSHRFQPNLKRVSSVLLV